MGSDAVSGTVVCNGGDEQFPEYPGKYEHGTRLLNYYMALQI